MKILYFVCFVFVLTLTAVGQTKIVTNLDLEKYKDQRVKAIADYRENYQRLGMPSPEELARRNEQDRKDLAELSVKLRTERLEKERLAAERERAERYAAPSNYVVYDSPRFNSDPYVYSTFYSGGRYYRRPIRQPYTQPGYFAGGNFWPTPGTTSRPQPPAARWIDRK